MRSGRKTWRGSTLRLPGSKGERKRLERIEHVPKLAKAFLRLQLEEWWSGLPLAAPRGSQRTRARL
jgi:hypothetical protein